MRGLVVAIVLIGCRPSVAGMRVEPVAAVADVPEVVAVAPVVVRGDRDGDGVGDAEDRCPDEAEDVDLFEDGDGCVDRDNDLDGVVDAFEWKQGRWTNCDRRIEGGVDVDCRNMPEDMDGEHDGDGCPDVVNWGQCQRELGRVQCDRAGKFVGDADRAFDEVAATLRAVPAVRIWVDGHVELRRDHDGAKRASQDVADRAVEELVRRGVARERLVARGIGDLAPRADNVKAAGRAANRRVEFDLQDCGGPGVGLVAEPAGAVRCL